MIVLVIEGGGGSAPGVDAAVEDIVAVVPDVVGLLELNVHGDVSRGHTEIGAGAQAVIIAVIPELYVVDLISLIGHGHEVDRVTRIGPGVAVDFARILIENVIDAVTVINVIVVADVDPFAVYVLITALVHIVPVVFPVVEIRLVVLVDLPRLGVVMDDLLIRRRAGGQQGQHHCDDKQGAEQFLFHCFLLQFTFSLY